MPIVTENESGEVAILARVLGGEHGELTVPMARHILSRGFNEADRARMNELAERNRKGTLKESERAELLSYAKAGNLLSVLKAKARRILRDRGRKRT